MMDCILIYALVDPRDDTVRYVGKTTNLKQRKACHFSSRRSLPLSTWIFELREEGLQPTVAVLEEVGEDDCWRMREQWWILEARRRSWPLLNQTNGGEGPAGGPKTPALKYFGPHETAVEFEAAMDAYQDAKAVFEAAKAKHRRVIKAREVEILREFDSGLINKPHVDGPKRFNVSAAAVYDILRRNGRRLKPRGRNAKEATA